MIALALLFLPFFFAAMALWLVLEIADFLLNIRRVFSDG